MGVEPLAMCYPKGSLRHIRGRPPTPRFRTIKVCPRTWRPLRDTLSVRQTDRAAPWPSGIRRWHKAGEQAPMSDMRRREFITLLGEAGARAAGVGAKERATDLRRCADKLRRLSGPVASLSCATWRSRPATSFAARKTGTRRGRSEGVYV